MLQLISRRSSCTVGKSLRARARCLRSGDEPHDSGESGLISDCRNADASHTRLRGDSVSGEQKKVATGIRVYGKDADCVGGIGSEEAATPLHPSGRNSPLKQRLVLTEISNST